LSAQVDLRLAMAFLVRSTIEYCSRNKRYESGRSKMNCGQQSAILA
jgi:hypothetical protein